MYLSLPLDGRGIRLMDMTRYENTYMFETKGNEIAYVIVEEMMENMYDSSIGNVYLRVNVKGRPSVHRKSPSDALSDAPIQ